MAIDCIFCKIAKKEAPAKIEYEDDDFVAFHSIRPATKVHILIVPKEHLEWHQDLSGKECVIGKIFTIAPKVAGGLGIKESGYKLVMNCGAGAGQEIDHFHMHLVGGWERRLHDQLGRTYELTPTEG